MDVDRTTRENWLCCGRVERTKRPMLTSWYMGIYGRDTTLPRVTATLLRGHGEEACSRGVVRQCGAEFART